MTDVTGRNFGLLIAYLIPGWVTLSALAGSSPVLRSWLATSPEAAPTIGGFLYATLASLAVGLTVSALRWLVLDSIHHRTGVRRPAWDFSALQANLAAFQGAVENHYRYYQFYGNTLIALLLTVPVEGPFHALFPAESWLAPGIATALAALLFVASRDALRKYYARTGAMLLRPLSPSLEESHDQRMAPRKEVGKFPAT